MIKFKNIFKTCLIGLFFVGPLIGANTLDDLLKKVLEEREYESKEFQNREKTFKKEKNKRKSMLIQAQKELKKEEALTRQLVSKFEKKRKRISDFTKRANYCHGQFR